MKRLRSFKLAGVLLTAGVVIAAPAAARESESVSQPSGKSEAADHYVGTIKSVDADGRSLAVMNFWSTRRFNLAEECRITVEGDEESAVKDLLPGHRVEVTYQDVDGVRIASAVAQQDERFAGRISAIDTNRMTLRVKHGWVTREFKATKESALASHDGSQLSFGDLKPGQSVAVRYYTPDEAKLVLKIEQKSLEFTGRVEVLDADRDKIDAGNLLARHTFQLSDDCVFVIDGKANGSIKDLQIGDRVTFLYEDVEGVPIASKVILRRGDGESDPRQLTRQDSGQP